MSVLPRYLTYDNTLYNSQFGELVLLAATVFKISSLPGIVSGDMHSSTVWAYLFMTALDLAILVMLYVFTRKGGDQLLRESKSVVYKLLLVIAAAYFAFKGLVYYAYAVTYIKGELFSDVMLFVVALLVLLPVAYLGIKGVKTIARATEIVFFPLLILIAINLIFVKTDMDFGRNLPILNGSFSSFAEDTLKYGQWLGDLTPLLFVKTKNKKVPWIGACTLVAAALVNIVAMLGVAMYGDGLTLVNNMLIRLGGFNQLSLEIGRIDWTALTAISVMGTIEIALLFWGVTQCAERLFSEKKHRILALKFARYTYPVIIFAAVVGVPRLNQITEVVTSPFGYAMTALALFLPLAALVLFAVEKRKQRTTSPSNDDDTQPNDASPLKQSTLLPTSQADTTTRYYSLDKKGENL